MLKLFQISINNFRKDTEVNLRDLKFLNKIKFRFSTQKRIIILKLDLKVIKAKFQNFYSFHIF